LTRAGMLMPLATAGRFMKERSLGQPSVEHAQQAFRFCDVAIARAFVFVVFACEFIEETDLAEHRADAAHLKHQPLNGLVARAGILGQQLPGFSRRDRWGRGLDAIRRRQGVQLQPLGMLSRPLLDNRKRREVVHEAILRWINPYRSDKRMPGALSF
jgi:hypothetical protein